jgi:hypothetical protein
VPADGTIAAKLKGAETSVRRRFLGSASDKRLLACVYRDGMPKVNNKGSSKDKSLLLPPKLKSLASSLASLQQTAIASLHCGFPFNCLITDGAKGSPAEAGP